MTHYPLAMMIEGGVAILLAVTIGYCVVLNARLKRLRGDRDEMRAMIAELVGATDNAQQAIRGLRDTAEECELNLSTHLNEAERFTVELAHHVNAGNAVLARITRITQAARNSRNHSELVDAEPAVPAVESPVRAALDQLERHDRAREYAA